MFSLLASDIKELSKELEEDFKSEMNYPLKQLNKEKEIMAQLANIGGLIKDIGIKVFASLVASPIYDHVRPLLGL